jgi:DNA modification methylase
MDYKQFRESLKLETGIMEYQDFINSKSKKLQENGFFIDTKDMNESLFPFQKYIIQKSLKEWAFHVSNHTNKPVLVLAPLAVSAQTIEEGQRWGIKVSKLDIKNPPSQNSPSIHITNYEQLKNIDCSIFSGVVLDESSILKSFSGKIKTSIIESFKTTPFKLACSATPSPNDELEIGNHSEFLGVKKSFEMVAQFFTTEKERIKGNKYRLKKHGENDFYRWIKSWSIVVSKPSDLGFSGEGYELPKLNLIEHKIVTPTKEGSGKLFNDVAVSATNFNKELRNTMTERIEKANEIIKTIDGSCIIWINQNAEGDAIKKTLPNCTEVRGSDKPKIKEKNLLGFAKGEFDILVTKPKIAQFGLNYQNCNNMIFVAPDFSFEKLYQAIRRSYRFGQKKEVNVHLITTDTMTNVIKSIKTKEAKFNKMRDKILSLEERKAIDTTTSKSEERKNENYHLINGDCVEETKKIETESIDFTFFSPPFGALYVFSDDPNDMSNVKSDDEFMQHFSYLVPELYRITKPGRLLSMHIMQGTTLKGRDGFYSIKDFRGELIRLFQKCGWYFHAENMIRKDPKTAAIRTKNHQLMWGTTKKDSTNNRPGLADYIITFQKPGINEVPVRNDIPFDLWCKIAEPVWLDINEGDTLPYREARDNDDERHITATQLKPIEWTYMMYVNKGERVFSPFSGVGSEGYVALKTGRKYTGIELKKSYFNVLKKNCKKAIIEQKQTTLF